jgi:2,3-bisphosphoglycerate-dependent phosphoglycerate mutase
LAPEVRTALHETGGCYSGHACAEIVGRPGMSRLEITREFPDFQIEPEIDGQGWWGCKPRESDADAALRAQRLWEQTIAEFGSSDESIALVMHADFKLMLLQRFHSAPLATPANSSVTTIIVEASAGRLIDYNSVRHLPPELITV